MFIFMYLFTCLPLEMLLGPQIGTRLGPIISSQWKMDPTFNSATVSTTLSRVGLLSTLYIIIIIIIIIYLIIICYIILTTNYLLSTMVTTYLLYVIFYVTFVTQFLMFWLFMLWFRMSYCTCEQINNKRYFYLHGISMTYIDQWRHQTTGCW